MVDIEQVNAGWVMFKFVIEAAHKFLPQLIFRTNAMLHLDIYLN